MNRLAAFTFALVCAFSSQVVTAGDIDLSLNLEFNTLGDLNSGGTWTVVGKSDERGIAGIVFSLENSTVNFNPSTGFLHPEIFDIQNSGLFGLRFEIVEGQFAAPVLDVGVIGGTWASTYVDDPALAIFGANPDLGSFSGGVDLATGSFDPGVVPTWFSSGFGGNQYVDPGAVVTAANNVFTTVRSVVPEPTTCAMLCIALVCIPTRKRR